MKEIIFKNAKPTIHSWHEFLAIKRNPFTLSVRDLQSSFVNSPWLSVDEFISIMSSVNAAGLSRDLAATYLYSRLFPSWMSGKGIAVCEYLKNSGIESSANTLFDNWLSILAADDRLSVAVRSECSDISLSRAYNATKPGKMFFLVIPAGPSLQLNSVINLCKAGSVDVIGQSDSFGLFTEGIHTYPVLNEEGEIYVREGNASEEVMSQYTVRLLAVRRR